MGSEICIRDRICPLFGYPVAAFREAEDEEMAQAGGADCGEGGFDEMD